MIKDECDQGIEQHEEKRIDFFKESERESEGKKASGFGDFTCKAGGSS